MTELSEIVGQDQALAALSHAMSAGRMPHALLFVGPAGVGRRTTAIALARALLCAKPVPVPGRGGLVQACGKCNDCRMMDAEMHGDLHVIRKELVKFHPDTLVRQRKMQELGIDVVLHFLLDQAARSPSRGRGKVFVVLEAEKLSDEAQNAMLKLLEEPPHGVTIILVAAQAELLLPTTLSRCRVVRFNLLPRDFVQAELVGREVEPAEAGFWAGFTGGSLGEAIRCWQRGLYATKRELLERLADPAGAAEFGEYLGKQVEKLAKTLVGQLKEDAGVELADSVAARQSGQVLLDVMMSAFRDAMLLASGAGAESVNADQPAVAAALARGKSIEQLAEILEHLADYQRLLWRNVNAKILWDNVAITCGGATAGVTGE